MFNQHSVKMAMSQGSEGCRADQGNKKLSSWMLDFEWCRYLRSYCVTLFFFSSFLFFKLQKYDNTFTGDLESPGQSYI